MPIQLRVKAFQRSQALRGLPTPSSLWTPPSALSLPRPASLLPKAYVLAVPSAWSAPSWVHLTNSFTLGKSLFRSCVLHEACPLPSIICLHITYVQSVQQLRRVWLFVTPWTAAHQAFLPITNSQSVLNLISIMYFTYAVTVSYLCPLLANPSPTRADIIVFFAVIFQAPRTHLAYSRCSINVDLINIIALQMEDIMIIPNNPCKNASRGLAEESRNRSLSTRNWGARGSLALLQVPHPLQPSQAQCERPLLWVLEGIKAPGCGGHVLSSTPILSQTSSYYTQNLLHPDSSTSLAPPPLPYKGLQVGKSVFTHPGQEGQVPVFASFPILTTSVQWLSLSDSLRPQGLQHARPPCPSPTPGIYSNSCPLSWWCHPSISSSVVSFSSCLQSFPASGSFQMSQFFTSGGQNIGVSASASVLAMNIQGVREWSLSVVSDSLWPYGL